MQTGLNKRRVRTVSGVKRDGQGRFERNPNNYMCFWIDGAILLNVISQNITGELCHRLSSRDVRELKGHIETSRIDVSEGNVKNTNKHS